MIRGQGPSKSLFQQKERKLMGLQSEPVAEWTPIGSGKGAEEGRFRFAAA
jgi:hypothetical protein